MRNVFERAWDLMQNPSDEVLQKSLANVHHDGLFSLVIGGNENGKLTRVFIATKKIKPFSIQLHTHRYKLILGVIQGKFEHHVANICGAGAVGPGVCNLDVFKYKSPLNGGTGLEFNCTRPVSVSSFVSPPSAEILLSERDIHTVSCSKGAIWIVEEQGFETDESLVIGKSFTLDNLYTAPGQYQINDMFQLVKKYLKPIVENTHV